MGYDSAGNKNGAGLCRPTEEMQKRLYELELAVDQLQKETARLSTKADAVTPTPVVVAAAPIPVPDKVLETRVATLEGRFDSLKTLLDRTIDLLGQVLAKLKSR